MSRLGNNGSGQTDWYGMIGSILAGFFTGQVATGLDVAAQTSPNMSVKVNPGIAMIPTGSGATASASLVRNDTAAGENVTIATANGSNPRNDLIVAYYDVAVIDTSNPNNPGSLKFAAVAGTPAATPADPSASTIQAAVGASNPYIVLARVVVGTGVTQITSANVTDLRTIVSLQNPFSAASYGSAGLTSKSPITTSASVVGSYTVPKNGIYFVSTSFLLNHSGANALRDYNPRIANGSSVLAETIWSAPNGAYWNSVNVVYAGAFNAGDVINFTISRASESGGVLSGASRYVIQRIA